MKVKFALAAMLFAMTAMAQQSARTLVPGDQRLSDVNINDLFGARNLRIIDVIDLAGNGKRQKMFGRIYYVEKTALVFYAVDLQDIKGNGAAFQAWGYDLSNKEKPENLGVFRMDNASLNRWVLRVNDPHILEHIDSVFVTVEDDPKGSSTPRGQKFLSAYLKATPNRS